MQDHPGVTIIRPIKGLDTELSSCLQATFDLQYQGRLEIIFCIAEEDDPAVPLVRSIIQAHPSRNARLMIDPVDLGPNPKICNIANAYEKAAHDLVWILDSNIFIEPRVLQSSIYTFKTTSCSLVHHLPIVVSVSSGLGCQTEETFLSTSHAKFYSAINSARIAPCLMGKSNLFRKSDLGPIDRFAKYICEDQLIGEYLWKHAGKHTLSADIAWQPIGQDLNFRAYWQRRRRWIRIRKYVVTLATLVEPGTECLLCGIIGAFAAHRIFSFPTHLFLSCHCLVWLMVDYLQFKTIHSRGTISRPAWLPARPRSFLSFLRSWLVREGCAFPIWLDAVAGWKVTWRNQIFQVNSDMTVTAS